ncbi:hypothetical protein CLF_105258 [Clonorchis sinensis]|uniref:DUF4817 domain-containing protein n=1 Tax=Clonorchis sinensis TaxID=79923 RepID=G7YDA3_CLOSI|nr:hypothetical protein CLF_105258 [Clonorchis sinensis]
MHSTGDTYLRKRLEGLTYRFFAEKFNDDRNSATAALRGYKTKYGLIKDPFIVLTITRLIAKVESTGSVWDFSGKGRKSLSDERAPVVQNAVEQLQSQSTMASSSITQVSQLTGIPRTKVHRIMRHHLHLYPYHFTLLQNITEEDKEQRVTFANWLLDNEEIVPNILWSAEANFAVDGIINKHNCVIWSRKAPHEYLTHNLCSPHLCVRIGFSSKCLLRPFFFDATVSGDSYLHMLQTHVILQLKQHKKSSTVFQQVGALPHYSNQKTFKLRILMAVIEASKKFAKLLVAKTDNVRVTCNIDENCTLKEDRSRTEVMLACELCLSHAERKWIRNASTKYESSPSVVFPSDEMIPRLRKDVWHGNTRVTNKIISVFVFRVFAVIQLVQVVTLCKHDLVASEGITIQQGVTELKDWLLNPQYETFIHHHVHNGGIDYSVSQLSVSRLDGLTVAASKDVSSRVRKRRRCVETRKPHESLGRHSNRVRLSGKSATLAVSHSWMSRVTRFNAELV